VSRRPSPAHVDQFAGLDQGESYTDYDSQIYLSPTSASSLTGERNSSARAKLLFRLVEPIAQYLPTDLSMYVSDHDLGSWILGEDQRLAAELAVAEHRYLSEADLKPFEKKEGRNKVKGLLNACPEDSPGWAQGLAAIEGRVPEVAEKGELSRDVADGRVCILV
jgi:hypothetical protein